MSLPLQRLITLYAVVAFCVPKFAPAQSAAPQVPSDWDLYMLRLVNRTRTDPMGEDGRLGTSYGESPAPPLAYSTQLGRAAQNHSEWMDANRNDPLVGSSLHHAEMLADGTSGQGTTIGWSADSFTDRIRYTDYSSNWKGENILKRSSPAPMSVATMDGNHAIWWNSAGHRALMMQSDFCAFGHHAANCQASFFVFRANARSPRVYFATEHPRPAAPRGWAMGYDA